MAMRAGRRTASSLQRLSEATPGRWVACRQLTCSARRRKDVAAQDDTPNMRHAQRPRMSLQNHVINATANALQLEGSYMLQSSTRRTSTKTKPPAYTPTANIFSHAYPNSSNSSPSGKTSSQSTLLRLVSFLSSRSSNTIPLLNSQWWRTLQL